MLGVRFAWLRAVCCLHLMDYRYEVFPKRSFPHLFQTDLKRLAVFQNLLAVTLEFVAFCLRMTASWLKTSANEA